MPISAGPSQASAFNSLSASSRAWLSSFDLPFPLLGIVPLGSFSLALRKVPAFTVWLTVFILKWRTGWTSLTGCDPVVWREYMYQGLPKQEEPDVCWDFFSIHNILSSGMVPWKPSRWPWSSFWVWKGKQHQAQYGFFDSVEDIFVPFLDAKVSNFKFLFFCTLLFHEKIKFRLSAVST